LTDGLFLEGGAQYYFFPGPLKGLLEAKPGFRAGLGYEFHHIRLSVQSGFTRITGTNPLVAGVELLPIYGKVGYRFTLPANFFILPEAGAGIAFSTTTHYRTALDMLMDNLTVSSTKSFAAALSLRLGWTVPGNFLDLFLGGGFELILEDDGPIPLPALEGGILLRPVALARLIRESAARKQVVPPVPAAASIPVVPAPEQRPVPETPPVVEPAPEAPPVEIAVVPPEEPPPEAPTPEPVIETPLPVNTSPPLNLSVTVYFEPDTAVLIPSFLPVLEDAVEKLRGSTTAVVELRGYAAPVGSGESCLEVSQWRALYCRDYFIEQAGIPEIRIISVWHGRDKTPEWEDVPEYRLQPDADRPLAAYRCVEIVVREE
jgi:outer membrane protein OmpA-like peptidoglycan-associated protein